MKLKDTMRVSLDKYKLSESRRYLVNYIDKNPGTVVRQIIKGSGGRYKSESSLYVLLGKMAKQGQIKIVTQDGYKRFYPFNYLTPSVSVKPNPFLENKKPEPTPTSQVEPEIKKEEPRIDLQASYRVYVQQKAKDYIWQLTADPTYDGGQDLVKKLNVMKEFIQFVEGDSGETSN